MKKITTILAATIALSAAAPAFAHTCYSKSNPTKCVIKFKKVKTVCHAIDTCYYTWNCERFKRVTYLHQTIDRCGRVLNCWKTQKTFKVGARY